MALSRAGLYLFGVFGASFLLEAKDRAATLLRLPSVSEWIARFDAGRPVAPVRFDIELAQPEASQVRASLEPS